MHISEGESLDAWFAASFESLREKLRRRIERTHRQFRDNRVCGGRTSEDLAEDVLTRLWIEGRRDALSLAWHRARISALEAIRRQAHRDLLHKRAVATARGHVAWRCYVAANA
ncbi:MAG: hypothetical protein IT459_23210 [Planctomycetes bacterium]|nr:hypothetical protein [Planctomycetota bacterium]